MNGTVFTGGKHICLCVCVCVCVQEEYFPFHAAFLSSNILPVFTDVIILCQEWKLCSTHIYHIQDISCFQSWCLGASDTRGNVLILELYNKILFVTKADIQKKKKKYNSFVKSTEMFSSRTFSELWPDFKMWFCKTINSRLNFKIIVFCKYQKPAVLRIPCCFHLETLFFII